jgi:hypothetical protein
MTNRAEWSTSVSSKSEVTTVKKLIWPAVLGIAVLGLWGIAPSEVLAQRRGVFFNYYPGAYNTYYFPGTPQTWYYPGYGYQYRDPGYTSYYSYPGYTTYSSYQPAYEGYLYQPGLGMRYMYRPGSYMYYSTPY